MIYELLVVLVHIHGIDSPQVVFFMGFGFMLMERKRMMLGDGSTGIGMDEEVDDVRG